MAAAPPAGASRLERLSRFAPGHAPRDQVRRKQSPQRGKKTPALGLCRAVLTHSHAVPRTAAKSILRRGIFFWRTHALQTFSVPAPCPHISPLRTNLYYPPHHHPRRLHKTRLDRPTLPRHPPRQWPLTTPLLLRRRVELPQAPTNHVHRQGRQNRLGLLHPYQRRKQTTLRILRRHPPLRRLRRLRL